MTREEKYLQVRKEAGATGLALAILIIFWVVAGFGMSSVDITIFSLPLWALLGTFGTWFMALFLVLCLTRLVFKDMRLDEADTEDETTEEAGKDA